MTHVVALGGSNHVVARSAEAWLRMLTGNTPAADAAFALVLSADLGSAGPAQAGQSNTVIEAALELSLDNLEALPRDPSNRWAEDERAADLGHRLFFDARLSASGRVSCASCHDPDRNFQDAI